MYKQNIAAAGMSDPCDLPCKFILHIYTYARFDENCQSLLGYPDSAICLVFNWSYFIGIAMNAFKSRESYEYFADGWVRYLLAWFIRGPLVHYL